MTAALAPAAGMASAIAPLLEARGLVKTLGGRRVVDGVDLTCAPGEVLGLIGPNGAGKTTSLRMCYGFLRPDAGSVRCACISRNPGKGSSPPRSASST